jgi:integrase
MLKRLEKKLGLEKRLHSHAFRHSHASLLAFQAVPLIEISSQLGHASIATTSAYMKKVAPADLASSLKKIDTKMLGINLPRIKI